MDLSKFKKDTIDFKKTVDGRLIGKNRNNKVIFPDKIDTLIQNEGTYDVALYREFEKYIFCIGIKRY
jgi:hypothetical protein